jgi:Mrp family chromosome partitioning ATPase
MPAREREEQKKDEDIKVERTLAKIKNRLLVFSGKGGVGKSTVAANLALALAKKGLKVGLLDVDIHGPNLAKMLGVEDEHMNFRSGGMGAVDVTPNLKLVSMSFLLQDSAVPVIWRGPMKMKVIQQFLGDVDWGELDWLIIDSPPGTGDEPLSIAQLIPATGAIIVTTPQDVSVMDSRKAVVFALKLNLKVMGIIENMSGMVCPHCKKRIDLFKEGGGYKAALELGVPFLGKIPIDPQIVASGDEGKPFVASQSESEAGKAFKKIVENITKITGQG